MITCRLLRPLSAALVSVAAGLPALADHEVEILVVTDSAFTAATAGDPETRALELVLGADSLFLQSATAPFVLTPIEVLVQSGGDPWPVSTVPGGDVDYVALLEDFSSWVASAVVTEHDWAVLLSGLVFDGAVPLYSYTGTVCTPLATAVVSILTSGAFDRASIAHALGHGLGGCHDPPAPRLMCPSLETIPGFDPETGEPCLGAIMSASIDVSDPPTHFSLCSEVDFREWLNGPLAPDCLEDLDRIFRDGFESGSTDAWLPGAGSRLEHLADQGWRTISSRFPTARASTTRHSGLAMSSTTCSSFPARFSW